MKKLLFFLLFAAPAVACADIGGTLIHIIPHKPTIAAGGISIVQSSGTVGPFGDPVSVTFSGAATAGNTIVVGPITTGEGHLATSVTDNKGNGYAQKVVSAGSSSEASLYASTQIATGGTSFTVTFDATGSGAITNMAAVEVAGVTVCTVTASGTGTGTTASSGAMMVGVANSIYFGIMTHEGASTTLTPSGGYLQIQEDENNSSDQTYSMVYKIQSSIVSEAATVTIGASRTWRMVGLVCY